MSTLKNASSVYEITGLGQTKVAMAASDINLESLDLSNEIRVKRNDLLIASEWTQVADAPVDKTAWGNL
jgi:hypothetical protein